VEGGTHPRGGGPTDAATAFDVVLHKGTDSEVYNIGSPTEVTNLEVSPPSVRGRWEGGGGWRLASDQVSDHPGGRGMIWWIGSSGPPSPRGVPPTHLGCLPAGPPPTLSLSMFPGLLSRCRAGRGALCSPHYGLRWAIDCERVGFGPRVLDLLCGGGGSHSRHNGMAQRPTRPLVCEGKWGSGAPRFYVTPTLHQRIHQHSLTHGGRRGFCGDPRGSAGTHTRM